MQTLELVKFLSMDLGIKNKKKYFCIYKLY